MRPGWGRIGRRAGAAVVGLALTACWPAPGQNPDRTAHNPGETIITAATVADLERSWEAQLDDGGAGPPVLSTGRVHVVAGYSVYGVDIRTGARVWKASAVHDPGVPEAPSRSTFVHNGELVVTGGGAALGRGWSYILWYDPATGAPTRPADDTGAGTVEALRGDRMVGNLAARGSGTPVLYSLVERTGDTSVHRGLLNIDAGITRVTLGRDRIYASGTSLVPPVIAESGGDVLYDDFGPGVRAYPFGAQTGRCTTDEGASFSITFECPTWIAPLDDTEPTAPVLAPDGSALYVGTMGGHAYAIDTTDGSVLWTADVGPVTAPPALADGTLYLPLLGGRIAALDAGGCGAATCAPLWTASTGGSVTAQPAVAGGVVFTGAIDGAVRALPADGCGAATCASLWEDELGSEVTGAPAVSRGRLYVGTADGRLVSYALAP